MTTQELLACATREATRYIKNAVNSKSETDYQKLKSLFENKLFVTNNFEDAELDILTFDWQSPDRDRNWWWQLQAMPFLNWYVSSLRLQTDEERLRYFSYCVDAIQGWVLNAKQNTKSPLVWHDHAAAFRVRNLTNWMLFCYTEGLPVAESDRVVRLGELITEHLRWIQNDEHYSKYTNHGFDQAMIALTIGLMFRGESFKGHQELNRERLKEEIAFAFTDEGVHKENSPGYQKMMLGRLKQLRTLVPLGEREVSSIGERYRENAEAFLRAVTLPNGYLPMIGDTRGGDEGLQYSQRNEIDVVDYSKSGYVIVRGTVLKKSFHLILKASHFSHYHRHDDDLSIHLYYDGKVLLGDGGLGSHNEKDKERISLRSNLAHNAPYIMNAKPARKVEDLLGKLPRISVADDCIIAESYYFGNLLRRELNLSRLLEGKIYVKDMAQGKGSSGLASNFYSTAGLHESSTQLWSVVDNNYIFKIFVKTGSSIEERSTYFSSTFGQFDKVSCFSVRASTNVDHEAVAEVEISLCESPKILHEVSYRGFGPIEIKEAGGWFLDDSYPGNVCHHIMSLRWINEVKSDGVRKSIIHSFVAYHEDPSNLKSRYYLGRQADHTASIRLEVLLDLAKKCTTDTALLQLLRRELMKNISSCLKETYKKNNNHGLMVDKAILQCLFEDEFLLEHYKDDSGFVINRVQCQLDGIFDEEGYCKEHSTSYQEYNLGTVIGLLEVIKKGIDLGVGKEIVEIGEWVERIKEASRRALGFLLKDDGSYITVGDSFSRPKPKILHEAYGQKDPFRALLPESKEEGVFFNKTLGVSVYRDSVVHLALNSSWHSYVHKQNDDLNFFLRLNGEDVFVEGGYSDIIKNDEIDTRSPLVHSTIIPTGLSWKDRSKVASGYSVIAPPVLEEQAVVFSGSHSRVADLVVSRVVYISEKKNRIRLLDSVSRPADCKHRFLIPKCFELQFLGKDVLLVSSVNSIRLSASCVRSDSKEMEPAWGSVSLTNVVKDNLVDQCFALDYASNGKIIFDIAYT